jgi:hypothetical protein
MLRKLSVAVALAAVVLLGSGVWARNPNPGVLPPSSHAFGTTYGDLAGAWWNWAVRFPAEKNPIVDDTGENGARG